MLFFFSSCVVLFCGFSHCYVLSNPCLRRPPPDIKRNPIPRFKNLQSQQLDVESEKVTGAEISDYVNVNFTGDVSVALIKEERNFYDRRHTALATLYERTLPELNRKGRDFSLTLSVRYDRW